MDQSSIKIAPGRIYFFVLMALLLGSIVFAAFGFSGDGRFSSAKQQLLLREVGHQVLLSSGDSTSRVLPVKQVAPGKYQVRFEKEFRFQTDSLVKIIRRALEKDDYPHDYIVNVLNCSGDDVLFGYAISRNERNNIIPCSGRIQPKGCYVVSIDFQTPSLTSIPQGYVIGGASLFAFVGLLAVRPLRRRKKQQEEKQEERREESAHVFQIGNTIFHPLTRLITIAGVATELTPKENKLLLIFAYAPNQVVERSRIQKEIWEDEGVIVGRSLDVFISKLRKKLENDETIRLVNVHGKGYKLVM